jgi:acyl-CoA thioesterase FadM
MIYRTLFYLFRARRSSALHPHDIGRVALRVLPTDLDTLRHVNNGIYLSLMDLGRTDLLVRSGIYATFKRLGYYPVVSNETVSFRRSLQPWQRFVLETRIVGYDAKAIFVEQRFVVDGEIYAVGFIRARFLKKTGGTVTVAELADATGVDPTDVPVPDRLVRWSEDVALPPSRATAPSVWE